MPSTSAVVCIECRTTFGCPRGIHATHSTNYRWRAPKKSNDRAWAKIAAGDWLWDKKAIIRKAVRRAGTPLDFWEARVRREESRRRQQERQALWDKRMRELHEPFLTDEE